MNNISILSLLSLCILVSETTMAGSKEVRKLLWDQWYTVSIANKIPYGYYHDKVEAVDQRIFFQNHYWKQEEGFINEEHLGAYAKNNLELTPLFFNFQTKNKTAEINIDASVENKGTAAAIMTIKTTKDKQQLAPFSKVISKNVFFEVFFPIWAAKNLPTLKVGQTKSFYAILEDGANENFQPISGWIRPEKEDAMSKQTKTKKITLYFRDLLSLWYIEESGRPCQIFWNSQNVLVKKATEKEAKSFLLR
ncbi:MAG: hypothetical protein HY843_01470 [Bdellovibrio sp.]|nr:hypothetical protein [Bdellovibrio sp.]